MIKKVHFPILLILLLVVSSCQNTVLVKVYGEEEPLKEAYKELSTEFETKGKQLMVAKYYEDADIIIVNGAEAAMQAGYPDLLKDADSLDMVMLKYSLDGKEKIVIAGKDDKSTANAIIKLMNEF